MDSLPKSAILKYWYLSQTDRQTDREQTYRKKERLTDRRKDRQMTDRQTQVS